MVQGRRCGNLALRASPYLFSFDHSPRSLHRRHNNRVLYLLRFTINRNLSSRSRFSFLRNFFPTGSCFDPQDHLRRGIERGSSPRVLRGKASRNPSRAAILGHVESKYKHDLRRPILDGTEFREIRRENETKFLLLLLNATINAGAAFFKSHATKKLFGLRIAPFFFPAEEKANSNFHFSSLEEN